MVRTQTSRMFLLAAFSGLAILSACRSLPVAALGEPSEKKQRALELQSLLERYTREFAWTVERAAEEITDATADLRIGRATVHWKLTAIPRVRELARNKSQGKALLALWLFTEAMAHDFEEGTGAESFGAAQPIAVAASRRLAAEIAGLARRIIDAEEDYAAAQAAIGDYVRRFVPRRGEGGTADFGSVEAGIRELTGSAGELEWLPQFTLQSINPFSGLNESAAAIREFTERTDRLVEDMSAELPWRLELLLYDLEERETVRQAVASLERASGGAASLAATAADWPTDVEEVVRTTLDELDGKQEGLRRTLRQAEQTLASAEELVSGLDGTATGLTAAGEAWGATFETLGLGDGGSTGEPAAPGKETRPFDILEYRDTAEELRRVAVELRGLLGDVRDLTADAGPGTPLGNVETAARTTAAAAAGEGRALADHVALRLLQLIGVVFLAAIGYRVVASRVTPRPEAGGATIGKD